MKKGLAQIPLILVLVALAVALPVLTLVANQSTENRSRAASCNENCSNVQNGGYSMIQSCHPQDSDGSTNDSLCNSTGRVETCGSLTTYYCCPSSGGQWTQTMSTECTASLAKLTPTAVPTAVPTVAPTVTPVPTSTTLTGAKVLNFIFSYAGVLPAAKCADGWPIAVTVVASDGTTKTASIVPTKLSGATSAGLAEYEASLDLSSFAATSGLSAFVKGSKHIQVKYGKDGQTAFYNQSNGTIDVSTAKTYDFSGYPLSAGDVNQDGVVNGVDFSQVKTAAIARNSVADGGNMVEDLNGNCQMESQDVGLLMITLNQKQDQLY